MIYFLTFSNFNLLIKGNIIFLLSFILISILFSIFIYKYTIPNISKSKKILLTFLRSLIFIIIILLLFESTISFLYKYENNKFTYLLIDNSNSIVLKDSSKTITKINSITNYLTRLKKNNIKIFSFDNNVHEIGNNSLLNFSAQGTNFYSVYNHLAKNKSEIENVVIISDGNLNQGEDPINNFEKLGLPIFTLGVGDTTTSKNVEINSVNHNNFVFYNKEIDISVIILNKGYENKNFNIRLYEEDKLILQKNDILNSSGFNKVSLKIKPSKIGEVKYKIEIDKFNGEESYNDNSKIFFINVLSNKLKIGLVSDAPSNDLTIISNALKNEENYQIIKYYKINESKSWIEPTKIPIDSIDVFFFINFPTKATRQNEIELFYNQIKKGKPFFISISNYTELEKLKYFSFNLPITIKSNFNESQKVNPDILQNEFISNFSQVSSRTDIWNKLAPIDQLNFNFTLKTESKSIVNSQFKNVDLNRPMMIIRNIGNERSFLFNGYNFWYWQFQTVDLNKDFISNFIIEIAKWLSQTKNKNYFSIRTNKKSYSQNEEVEFYAELYDQSFNPIDTSKISVKIKNTSSEIDLTPQGNGVYSGKVVPNSTGEILFEATNSYYKNSLSRATSRFYVSNIPIEKTETKLNSNYLKQISLQTNGKYFYIDDAKNIRDFIVHSQATKNEITIKKNFELWHNKFIIIALIFLLSIEWLTRKLFGMI